jgi:hypothetical protein|eukprot:COSAG01_NODE_2984_length_6753_cov_235.182447_3_plen_108_part_00
MRETFVSCMLGIGLCSLRPREHGGRVAIYIMGMTPTRLKTARELHARRLAYELDLPWYPDHNHRAIAEHVFAEHTSQGGNTQSVRHFSEANAEVQRLIDPTFVSPRL